MSWGDTWIDIPYKPKTLEAETVQNADNDEEFIYQALIDIGLTPATQETIAHTIAEYKTPIANVRTQLRTIESNLNILKELTESVYYGEAVDIGSYFTKEMYQRWYDILYDYKNNIIPDNRGWAILELSDCIPTIDGKDIAIRGEEFGT